MKSYRVKANKFYQVKGSRVHDLSKADLVSQTADKTLVAKDTGSCFLFADAAATFTLPAATGSGVEYEFIWAASTTSNGVVACAGTDEFAGNVSMIDTDDDSQVNYPALAADNFDTLTANGTTTGGIAGSRVRVIDIASGVWYIEGLLIASGVVATPLAAS